MWELPTVLRHGMVWTNPCAIPNLDRYTGGRHSCDPLTQAILTCIIMGRRTLGHIRVAALVAAAGAGQLDVKRKGRRARCYTRIFLGIFGEKLYAGDSGDSLA